MIKIITIIIKTIMIIITLVIIIKTTSATTVNQHKVGILDIRSTQPISFHAKQIYGINVINM